MPLFSQKVSSSTFTLEVSSENESSFIDSNDLELVTQWSYALNEKTKSVTHSLTRVFRTHFYMTRKQIPALIISWFTWSFIYLFIWNDKLLKIWGIAIVWWVWRAQKNEIIILWILIEFLYSRVNVTEWISHWETFPHSLSVLSHVLSTLHLHACICTWHLCDFSSLLYLDYSRSVSNTSKAIEDIPLQPLMAEKSSGQRRVRARLLFRISSPLLWQTRQTGNVKAMELSWNYQLLFRMVSNCKLFLQICFGVLGHLITQCNIAHVDLVHSNFF